MNSIKFGSGIMLMSIFALGCGGSMQLSSQWTDSNVTVDGKYDEWRGATTYVEDKNLSLGFFHDEQYLYVSMRSNSRELQTQFMALGFTLWFDPQGGKDKEFGIKFPVGMLGSGLMLRAGGGRPDPESLREQFRESLTELELFLPGEKEPRRLARENATGIEVSLGDMQDPLTYEIKVPLHASERHPYVIGVQDGKVVGVGFETGEIDRDALREQMGNRHGRFGGRGGFAGRGGMRGRPERPEALELWAAVTLEEQKKAIPNSE